MAFLDISFPLGVARGALSTTSRRTEVVTVGAGWEERNSRWADSRRTEQAGLGLRDAGDLDAVLALFEEARGCLHSFRFCDWLDWRSAPAASPITATDMRLGEGDGAAVDFQLRKSYGA